MPLNRPPRARKRAFAEVSAFLLALVGALATSALVKAIAPPRLGDFAAVAVGLAVAVLIYERLAKRIARHVADDASQLTAPPDTRDEAR